jgi:ABC-2 type transport system permease protein
VLRYLRLLGIQVRASALLAMQYRLDFVVDGVMTIFWTGAALIPLLVLYQQRTTIAGWTFPEALLVVAWFTILKGLVDAAIQPSLLAIVEHIRKGTLDFVLLKPADAQFLASTARFEPWKSGDAIGGLVVLGWAISRLGLPTPGGVAAALLLLVCALVMLYAILILVISLAFRVVKVDNLAYLFLSIYDAARWPGSVFRGVLSFLFTFVVPLVVMTTFPALAILGKLTAVQALGAVGGAAVLAIASRGVWQASIRHYTSAGG